MMSLGVHTVEEIGWDRVFASYTNLRPLLRGLEQAHRATLDDHVHRPPRLGQWVLISIA